MRHCLPAGYAARAASAVGCCFWMSNQHKLVGPSAGDHIHNRAARLRGGFRLHGDVAAGAAHIVVDPKGIGQGGPA